MRHLHSTKLQHLRKSTMKQTASAPSYAACAVIPRIRNAEARSSSLLRGTSFHYTFSAFVNKRKLRCAALCDNSWNIA